jgi:hypothetical protein
VVDLSVSVRVELRDAIDAEARRRGMSRAGLVAMLAEEFLEKQAVSRNRQATRNSPGVPVRHC